MQALPPPGSRVAFCSRYSTALQSYSSIEGQERQNAAYAEKHGWVEAGRYSDAERSGTTTMGREGLFKMLAAAERGEFDVLLVEDIDRASRDAADMHMIAKNLEETDVVLFWSASESLPRSSRGARPAKPRPTCGPRKPPYGRSATTCSSETWSAFSAAGSPGAGPGRSHRPPRPQLRG